MKRLLFFCLTLLTISAFSQTRVNPIIKSQGGVFPVPYADEKPDPNLEYNIVIEIERPSDKPDTLSWALNNVARLLNLHASGGVPKEKLHVILAIHGGAAYT
ncbi:MAG: hypothetical protein IT213_14605, partial [Cytophagales bacterium]|nr:hypothetical protein [Cytophagales bacterium]